MPFRPDPGPALHWFPRAREPLTEQDVLSLVPFRSWPPWPPSLSGTVESTEFWPGGKCIEVSSRLESREDEFEVLLRMGSLARLLCPDARPQLHYALPAGVCPKVHTWPAKRKRVEYDDSKPVQILKLKKAKSTFGAM